MSHFVFMMIMMISGDLYVELPTRFQSQSLIPSVPLIIYYILYIVKVLVILSLPVVINTSEWQLIMIIWSNTFAVNKIY